MGTLGLSFVFLLVFMLPTACERQRPTANKPINKSSASVPHSTPNSPSDAVSEFQGLFERPVKEFQTLILTPNDIYNNGRAREFGVILTNGVILYKGKKDGIYAVVATALPIIRDSKIEKLSDKDVIILVVGREDYHRISVSNIVMIVGYVKKERKNNKFFFYVDVTGLKVTGYSGATDHDFEKKVAEVADKINLDNLVDILLTNIALRTFFFK